MCNSPNCILYGSGSVYYWSKKTVQNPRSDVKIMGVCACMLYLAPSSLPFCCVCAGVCMWVVHVAYSSIPFCWVYAWMYVNMSCVCNTFYFSLLCECMWTWGVVHAAPSISFCCVCVCMWVHVNVSGACSIFFYFFLLCVCVYVNMSCACNTFYSLFLVISSQPLTEWQLVWLLYELSESFCLHHPTHPVLGLQALAAMPFFFFKSSCLRFKLGLACTENI